MQVGIVHLNFIRVLLYKLMDMRWKIQIRTLPLIKRGCLPFVSGSGGGRDGSREASKLQKPLSPVRIERDNASE